MYEILIKNMHQYLEEGTTQTDSNNILLLS